MHVNNIVDFGTKQLDPTQDQLFPIKFDTSFGCHILEHDKGFPN